MRSIESIFEKKNRAKTREVDTCYANAALIRKSLLHKTEAKSAVI